MLKSPEIIKRETFRPVLAGLSKVEARPSINITREQTNNHGVITLERENSREQFINAVRNGRDELSVFDGFPPATGNVVAQMAFGGRAFCAPASQRMGGVRWPMLWAQGDECRGAQVSGMQAYAIEGLPVRQVVMGGRVLGSRWADPDAEYCQLAGILPADLNAARGIQTRSCLEQIEVALAKVGMDFSHVARTWFYLENLLDWYEEFNSARTAFFKDRHVFDRLIPASTGIGASNPHGTALVAGALAIRPKSNRIRIQEVESPLQCPATDYRSSFSRAVEVAYSDHRRLLISGTASIAADGTSVFAGDVVKQIHLTLDVVEAILKSRGMHWQDTVRAVGYFRDIGDLPTFDDCCRVRRMSSLPLTPAHATVCRDDLLFELELDAIAASARLEN